MDYEEIRDIVLNELTPIEKKCLLTVLHHEVMVNLVEENRRLCMERLHEILPEAARIWGVSGADIIAKNRRRAAVDCRNAIVLRMYREDFSIRSISEALGLSRSTIMYAIDEVAGAIASRNPSWSDYREKWNELNRNLDQRYER